MSTLIGELLNILSRKPEAYLPGILTGPDTKHQGAMIRDQLLGARRFHLSSSFSEAASKLGFEADKANTLLSLARAPFDLIWLEWNLADQFAGVGLIKSHDSPDRVGVLVKKFAPSQYLITSVMPVKLGSNRNSHILVVSPVSILYDTDQPLNRDKWAHDRDIINKCVRESDVIRLSDFDSEQIKNLTDGCLVGGGVTVKTALADQTTFISHASHILTPSFSNLYLERLSDPKTSIRVSRGMAEVIAERVLEASGLLRFVTSALALMNSREYVHVQTIKPTDKKPPQTIKSNLRSPVYDFVDFIAKHEVVVRDVLVSQTHESKHVRPMHEVIGHFAQSHRVGDDSCEHQYEKRGPNSWVCLLCTKKRWYRREHVRGDSSVGTVSNKDRLVKT
jgi:hypothetical protein